MQNMPVATSAAPRPSMAVRVPRGPRRTSTTAATAARGPSTTLTPKDHRHEWLVVR